MANPAQPEPLNNLITLPSGLRVCSSDLGAAAAAACLAWNMGEITSPTSPGFGGGRNFCTRVGVNSIASLDTNPTDGFTDSPPFTATDAFTFEEPVSGEDHGLHDQALHRRILAEVPGGQWPLHALSHARVRSSPRPAGGIANSGLAIQATCLSPSTFRSSTETSGFVAAIVATNSLKTVTTTLSRRFHQPARYRANGGIQCVPFPEVRSQPISFRGRRACAPSQDVVE